VGLALELGLQRKSKAIIGVHGFSSSGQRGAIMLTAALGHEFQAHQFQAKPDANFVFKYPLHDSCVLR
jgi:hypothetical protein